MKAQVNYNFNLFRLSRIHLSNDSDRQSIEKPI